MNAVLFMISVKKITPKVSRIIRMAYFAERMDCWYCSTGILKFTPKLELSISLIFEVLKSTITCE